MTTSQQILLSGVALAVLIVASQRLFQDRSEASVPASLQNGSVNIHEVPGPGRQDWERLLAADGSPAEDLAVMEALLHNLISSSPVTALPTLGSAEDLASALSDPAGPGGALLPEDHPALRRGSIVDRWGSAWIVHAIAADRIGIRSAGPDRIPYSPDDLVGRWAEPLVD